MKTPCCAPDVALLPSNSYVLCRADFRQLLILAMFCLTFWGLTCGMWDLRGPDEGRYVQISKELTERSNWLSLTLHDRPYDQKPPLAFWTMAAMIKLLHGHVSSWAVRFPSVLAGTATVILAWLIAFWSSRGNRRVALSSALVLLTSPLFAVNVPQAELNIQFTFWITLAMAVYLAPAVADCFSAKRAILFWAAIAGAFFTKGPLAFLIILLVLAADALRRRSWRTFLRVRPFPGLFVFLLLIGGWLYAQRMTFGAEFVAKQVQGETVQRFLHGDHSEPFWYYFPRLFTSLFPWGFLLPAVVVAGWKQRLVLKSQPAQLLWAWAVLPFLILCLASGKRQSYMLPLFPPVAVLIAQYLIVTERAWSKRPGAVRFARAFALLSGLGFLGAGAFLLFYSPVLKTQEIDVHIWFLPVLVLAASVLIFLVIYSARTHRYKLLLSPLPMVIITMVVIFLVQFTTYEPALDGRSTTKPFANEIDGIGAAAITSLGKASKPEYHVYGNYEVVTVTRGDLPKAEKFTDLILTTLRDARLCSGTLERAGFRTQKQFHVSRDDLVLFERRPEIMAGDSHPILSSEDSVSFALMGDVGTGNDQIRNVANSIAALDERTSLSGLFLLGDNLYTGENFATDIKTEFEEPFQPLLTHNIPVFAILGNHDYINRRWRHEVTYIPYHMGGRRYYTRTFGKSLVTFFALDSESLNSKSGDPGQLEWFRKQLAACHSKWRILLIHRPLLASNVDHGPSIDLYKKLRPILNGPGGDIDLVFSGHNHLYERRAIGEDGILHVTAGSGGKLTRSRMPSDSKRSTDYVEEGLFVYLRLDEEILQMKAINEEGTVVDAVDLKDLEDPPKVVIVASATPLK